MIHIMDMKTETIDMFFGILLIVCGIVLARTACDDGYVALIVFGSFGIIDIILALRGWSVVRRRR